MTHGTTTGMTLTGLQFAVGDKILLQPLTLDIGRQGVTGIIGQNGSGKSTLLRLLARQQPPSGGTIRYDGRDVVDWPDRAFARAVGYLPQHVPITTRLTVRELVDIVVYGGLAHSNPQKAEIFEAWEKSGIMGFVWAIFFAAMRDMMLALQQLRTLNEQVLAVADPKRPADARPSRPDRR